MGRNDVTPTLVLFGPSDHVIYPAFDRMAAQVFAKCVGPFLLRDCGHFVPWEAPGPLVSGTVAFCSDLLRQG
jgi:pimeloyl-ACP methyl ester carboxylesterase